MTADYTAAKAAGKTKATDVAGFIKESITDPNAYIAKGFAPGDHARHVREEPELEADR